MQFGQEMLERSEAIEGWQLVDSAALLRLPDQDGTDRKQISAIAALPVGTAITAHLEVDPAGEVTATVCQYGFGTPADLFRPSLALLLPSLAPGVRALPGKSGNGAVALEPILPSWSGSGQRLFEAGPVAGSANTLPVMPVPPVTWPWDIVRALAILAANGSGMLSLTIRNMPRNGCIRRVAGSLQKELIASSYSAPDDKAVQAGLINCRAMLRDPALFVIEAAIRAPGCDETLCNMVALALFGTLAGEPLDQDIAVDLRQLTGSRLAPANLLPGRHEMHAVQAASPVAEDRTKATWKIGRAVGGVEVGLTPSDRARHVYVIGATGTGKSTLLRSLIEQDAEAGQGIILIDPHGDLASEVAWALPKSRRGDLIYADAGAQGGGFAVDLLPPPDDKQGFEIAADMLISICKDDLYSQSKDAFGPLFENYFRQALALLLAAKPEDRTLANFPRVFEDGRFRRELIGACQEQDVVSFWRNTALRTTGEIDLTNVTPYITSKMTKFVSSPQARAIFPGSGHGIDFAGAMDSGKILVLRCPKGSLGESLSELAVSASLMKIRNAAMARASRIDRRPVRLYIDEFQNCRGSSLQTLLAEGRKFGISLTLANQSLGQIGGTIHHSLGSATLANVGSLIAFRVGASDALQLAPWLDAPERWRELCQLSDFTMNARLLENGRPANYYGLKGAVRTDLKSLSPTGGYQG